MKKFLIALALGACVAASASAAIASISYVSPAPEAGQWLMMLVGISAVAARAMRR